MGDPKAVGYSGPTFITIRSGKHSSSTALSHSKDLEVMMEKEELKEQFKLPNNVLKPIFIRVVDGGPDENPRYTKVVSSAIRDFKKYGFDALFIATNAPGRSAFNRVERRMAPLSQDLVGLILPHTHYGNHLNEKNETVNDELESENFAYAGGVLAEIWSSTIIDKFSVIAEYVNPTESEITLQHEDEVSANWKSIYVRESHYLLQIVKYEDRMCCSAPRSHYFTFLPRFLPPPVRPETNTNDVNIGYSDLFLATRIPIVDNKYPKGIPFDYNCPSIQPILFDRTCSICGIYHSSLKSLASHKKIHKRAPRATPDPVMRRILPVRRAATRQKERMVVWKARLNGGEEEEHCDWFEEGEIDIDLGEEQDCLDAPSTFPVVGVSDRASPWETL